MPWYGVRAIIRWSDEPQYEPSGKPSFEETIRLVEADSWEGAIEQCRAGISDDLGPGDEDLGLYQVFEIAGEPVTGTEVFSLVRHSQLDGVSYLARYFKTGAEAEIDL